ncbi:MAG: S8 family serine peptidase, partial [Planctomycetota bacterium]
PVRALNDDGIGSTSTIAQGIYWAVTQGARVINVSIEMQAETIAVRRAIEFATDSGVLVVAAVGNAGRDEVVFPARNGDVVGVASVRADGVAAGFTNTGSEVDFVAPGVQVIGALPLDLNPTGAGRWSGTSFSTPIVAGVFALMAERFPDQDPSQWRDRLRDTALSVESQNPAVGGDLGNGWAQPAAALR